MEALSSVSNNVSIPFSQIMKASYAGGTINIPVSSTIGVYARFEHINGVPSSNGENVSFSRLRQLDTLINQISKLKNREIDVNTENLDSAASEKLADELSSQMRELLTSQSAQYVQGIYTPGTFFNMTA